MRQRAARRAASAMSAGMSAPAGSFQYSPRSRLSDEFPGTPVPEVTQAFLRVRFGLMSPSAEEVASVEQAVERAGQRGTGPAAPEQGGDESSNEAPDDGQ